MNWVEVSIALTQKPSHLTFRIKIIKEKQGSPASDIHN